MLRLVLKNRPPVGHRVGHRVGHGLGHRVGHGLGHVLSTPVEVGKFNEFLRKHGSVEQFVRIFGLAGEEEKIFIYFTVYRKFVLLRRATGLL